jgi:hypothetical protein
MKSRTSSVYVDAPVEVAFDCIKHPGNFNELMPGVRFTEITTTPDGVGTRYRFETRVAGFPVRGTGVFTEVLANRRIHDETSIAVEGAFDWRFEPEGAGVHVTIEHHPGRLWNVPFVGRLLADGYERTDRQVLARLKAKLESGGTPPH